MEEVMNKEAKVAEKQQQVEKVLIICARGTLEDVYAALIMANGALAEGKEAWDEVITIKYIVNVARAPSKPDVQIQSQEEN